MVVKLSSAYHGYKLPEVGLPNRKLHHGKGSEYKILILGDMRDSVCFPLTGVTSSSTIALVTVKVLNIKFCTFILFGLVLYSVVGTCFVLQVLSRRFINC